MVAVPAVLRERAILDNTVIVRVSRSLEDCFNEVDGVVEIVVVHRAAVDVDLALELWSKGRPIALENVTEVVVLAPVLGDPVIDLAGEFVPDPLGITILSHRAVDGFPDVPLIS